MSDRKSRFRLSIIGVMALMFLSFLAWAAWFQIDQTVRAQGTVIASARTQIIQAADGGVLAQILVQEGQEVKPGQRLALLEKDRSSAAFQESRSKAAALQAALIRARAESMGTKPAYPPSLRAFPDFVIAQERLYAQKRASLEDITSALEDSLKLAQEELQMTRSLLTAGDVSRIEVMRALRQVSEIEARLSEAKNKYIQEARLEVTRLEDELSSQLHKLEERRSVLEHTEMVAPVAGIVKFLRVNTVGGVLRAGDELMQLSPTDGDMVIEAKINPVDIGQLELGLPVQVKLDAFDFSVYGMLLGKLTYISSDTLVEQGPNGQSLSSYRAHIRIDPQQSNPMLARVALKPGMTTTIDIKTRTRSVLQYLLKPVIKSFSGALNER
ncbi:MAG: HlyD family efflux transporter periplasmic adaptor subunit [Betaproteobacteria bacterium]|nr:HlyD family efflux transporter periplasmic adaptor subunit [Betaproteobacteria bacterium]